MVNSLTFCHQGICVSAKGKFAPILTAAVALAIIALALYQLSKSVDTLRNLSNLKFNG